MYKCANEHVKHLPRSPAPMVSEQNQTSHHLAITSLGRCCRFNLIKIFANKKDINTERKAIAKTPPNPPIFFGSSGVKMKVNSEMEIQQNTIMDT